MMEDRPAVMESLEYTGAFLTGHFPLTSGRHSDRYVNKDAITVFPQELDLMANYLARQFSGRGVEVVCAAAVGSIALGVLTALALGRLDFREVKFVYAEHGEEKLAKAERDHTLAYATLEALDHGPPEVLSQGDQVLIKRQSMTLKRGYAKIVPNARVLFVEDILTTGGSAAAMVSAVRLIQLASGDPSRGEIVGLGCLVNRGGVIAETLRVPELFALAEVEMDSWEPADCPLCRNRVALTPMK